MTPEQIECNLEVKFEKESDPGYFEGYASIFGNKDLGGDICVKGCFTDTLAEHKASKTLPQMFFMHDKTEPVGDWLHMEEDQKGLFVQGRLWVGKGIPKAEQAYLMMKGTGPKGLSIGYKTVKAERKDGARQLLQVKLAEASVVGRGMNQKALVTSVKDESGTEDENKAALESLRGIFDDAHNQAALGKLMEFKFNPNHDEQGRFTSGGGGGGGGGGARNPKSMSRDEARIEATRLAGKLMKANSGLTREAREALKARVTELEKHHYGVYNEGGDELLYNRDKRTTFDDEMQASMAAAVRDHDVVKNTLGGLHVMPQQDAEAYRRMPYGMRNAYDLRQAAAAMVSPPDDRLIPSTRDPAKAGTYSSSKLPKEGASVRTSDGRSGRVVKAIHSTVAVRMAGGVMGFYHPTKIRPS